jgi:phage gp36-like protein
MGRYIDWADIANRYPTVARERGGEQTGMGVFVDDAEGEVDARLAPKYTVPFVPGSSYAPQIVRTLSIDIAYYRLNMQQKWAETLKEYIDARFKALLDGTMLLVNSSGTLAANDVAAWTDRPYRSSFGPDDPTNYSISDSWQTDAEDERDGD